MKRLAVYCGSASPADSRYVELAREVGATLARRGIGLVYGGGRLGLMGAVASGALEAGGEVIGVIPEALVSAEVSNTDCTELHVVANMHQRKAMMAERSHAFLALPGGIGTFEELFEVWTWRQLGYHDKPIGILNVAGYYDSMLQFLQGTVQSEFMGDWQMELVRSGEHIPQLLAHLIEAAGTSPESQSLEKNI